MEGRTVMTLSANEDRHRRAGDGQGVFLSQQEERMEMRKQKADRQELADGSIPSGQRGRCGPDRGKQGSDTLSVSKTHFTPLPNVSTACFRGALSDRLRCSHIPQWNELSA